MSTTDPFFGVEYPEMTLHTDPETRREWVTISDFPQRIAVEQAVIDAHDPRLATFRLDGDRLRIEVSNGWCSYRVVHHDPYRDLYVCERLAAS